MSNQDEVDVDIRCNALTLAGKQCKKSATVQDENNQWVCDIHNQYAGLQYFDHEHLEDHPTIHAVSPDTDFVPVHPGMRSPSSNSQPKTPKTPGGSISSTTSSTTNSSSPSLFDLSNVMQLLRQTQSQQIPNVKKHTVSEDQLRLMSRTDLSRYQELMTPRSRSMAAQILADAREETELSRDTLENTDELTQKGIAMINNYFNTLKSDIEIFNKDWAEEQGAFRKIIDDVTRSVAEEKTKLDNEKAASEREPRKVPEVKESVGSIDMEQTFQFLTMDLTLQTQKSNINVQKSKLLENFKSRFKLLSESITKTINDFDINLDASHGVIQALTADVKTIRNTVNATLRESKARNETAQQRLRETITDQEEIVRRGQEAARQVEIMKRKLQDLEKQVINDEAKVNAKIATEELKLFRKMEEEKNKLAKKQVTAFEKQNKQHQELMKANQFFTTEMNKRDQDIQRHEELVDTQKRILSDQIQNVRDQFDSKLQQLNAEISSLTFQNPF